MSNPDPNASTASLLSTNTTSSSFDPNKDKSKKPQKDYSAALSALQSKYGLADSSASSAPPPPSSKKSSSKRQQSASSPTSSATPPSSSASLGSATGTPGKGNKSKKSYSSAFALLQGRYGLANSVAPASPVPSTESQTSGEEDVPGTSKGFPQE